MSNSTDYYELLHIQPDAPDALIKASYRTLMQKLRMHPDLGGDADTASRLNVAYATLANPVSRAKYDELRSTSPQVSDGTTARQQNPGTANVTKAPEPARIMWNPSDDRRASECLFCTTPHAFGNNPPLTTLCETCACPLASVDTRELLAGERRALERLQLERQISYRSGLGATLLQAETSDLSLRGLKFHASANLINNQLIQITSLFCLALGRVAHISATDSTRGHGKENQFGIEFLTLCFPNTQGSLVSTRA